MLSKNQIRENKLKQFYGNDTVLQFDEQVYFKASATLPIADDLKNLLSRIFDTWIAIVKGDYDDDMKDHY